MSRYPSCMQSAYAHPFNSSSHLLSMNERRIAPRKEQNDKRYNAHPSYVWLKWSFPGQTVPAYALLFASIVEAEVDDANNAPIDQRRDGYEVCQ